MARTAVPKQTLLAASLAEGRKAARDGILKFSALSRVHRERLVNASWLQEVIKGWYMLVNPQVNTGESTGWYLSYWAFLKAYLTDRFGEDYCLSAESSLDLVTGSNTIPVQTSVIVKQGSHLVLSLPHKTSLLIYSDKKNFPTDREQALGIQVMPLPLLLARIAPSCYLTKPREVELALKMIPDASEVSRALIGSGFIASAARIAGAYEFLGDREKANQISSDLKTAGYKVKSDNPFKHAHPLLPNSLRVESPYAARIEGMWLKMRDAVTKSFPKPPGKRTSKEECFRKIDDQYVHDAYNSLSIEGYQVTEELISRVRDGIWNPDGHPRDAKDRDALAAKGYNGTFERVKQSISKMLDAKHPGALLEKDLQDWYRELFLPTVKAGLLEEHHLVGYRASRVGIRGSMHVPPPREAVMDCMEKYFELVKKEDVAAVRAVLGHFIFVFIHPYMDGNGRLGRFIMNAMLVSGGYDWTVVQTVNRKQYLDALEQASVHGKIEDLASFLKNEMKVKRIEQKGSNRKKSGPFHTKDAKKTLKNFDSWAKNNPAKTTETKTLRQKK